MNKIFCLQFIITIEAYIHGLVPDCNISIVLAMEILKSCSKPLTWNTFKLIKIAKFMTNINLGTVQKHSSESISWCLIKDDLKFWFYQHIVA